MDARCLFNTVMSVVIITVQNQPSIGFSEAQ